MAAIAIQHREQIINLAATGITLQAIASMFGIQPPAISKHLAKDPEYQAARETAAEIRLDEREEDLMTCPPIMPEISRASTALRHQQWRCEREFPHRWGAKQQLTVEHRVTVDERLADDLSSLLGRVVDTQRAKVIDGDECSTGVMSNPSLPSPVADEPQSP